MKKLFMMAFAVVSAMALTVSCDSDYAPDSFLDEATVSSSYVAIDVNGGSSTIELSANGSWEIANGIDWLTVSPMSGSAGNSTITFSAASTMDGRNGAITINVGGKSQYINVIQGLSTVAQATCAEVIAGPDSKTYLTKGVVTAITNTTYGNFYINDGTGEIYIYGTLYAGKTQNNPIKNNNIEVGDEITVQGPKTTYNGVVELVDVTVVKVAKSLIKCDSTYVAGVPSAELPIEGGEITAYLTNKGNGLFVDVPADAQSWLSIKSVQGNTVIFHAAANTAGPRSTTLTFKTTDGKKDYSAETTISQDGLSGTLELPMTVEEAIAAANKGVTSAVYIKGIVSKVLSGGYGAQYGNASFWISADGNYNEDLTLDFEVYQANWLGGNKWTEYNAQIAEGAEVIVYGPLTTYKGTAETQGKGAAHVHSVNGVTTDEYGIGTLADPFYCVGAIAAAQAGIASKVYVSGVVSELVSGGMSASYGNGSFWMSDDGVKHGDLSLDFEAYQVNYLGGEKWTEADPQIAVGDVVVIYGPLTTYKGTSETQGKGAAYIYSINPEMPTE